MRIAIHTKNSPSPGGTYSQAIKAGNLIFLAGQIPMHPETEEMLIGDFSDQVRRVFENMKMVAGAAGGSLEDITKLTVFLTDLTTITVINEVMKEFFLEPYPARTTIEVSTLPKNSPVEIEGIMVLSS